MLKRILPLLLVPGLMGTSWGASPFVGNWKLDPSKSTLTDQMSVERLGGNRYVFHLGAGAETITADGTDQPGQGGTTLSVTAAGPDAWKVIRKRDGHVLISASWKLSKDGSSLMDDFTSFGKDGSPSNVKYVYKRKARGSGFAGTWMSTTETMNFAYVLQIRPYAEDGLSIIDSTSQLTRNMRLDGKDYPNAGANAAIIAASSLRKVGERTLELTDKKAGGELYDVLRLDLSPDLKTLTITPQSKAGDRPHRFLFERQ